MGRILAIDYGKKRTGLAVSDPLKIIATPLTTVETSGLDRFLDDYLASNAVDAVVVGMPRNMDYTPSESYKYIKPFVERFLARHPSMKVEMVDERFTSVLAMRSMIDSGVKKSDRRDKGAVDRVSATIILQSYMESVANR